MLIHLDKSAIDGCLEGPHVSKCLACLQDLLRAFLKDYHLLSIDPQDAVRLALSPVWGRLSGDHKEALEQIRSRASETEGVRNILRYHLLLGLGPDFDGRSVQQDDGRISIRASFLAFDGVATERSVLLCENLTDADFFCEIARLVLGSRRWKLGLTHHSVQGSGSSCGEIAAHAAAEGKVLLGIADSDRTYENDSLGDTARALVAALKGKPAFQHPHVLPTREAENLLPLTFYKRVLEDDRQSRAPQLSRLSVLQRTLLTPEEHAHADIKDGLTLFQLESKTSSEAEQPLWSTVAKRRGFTECRNKEIECTTEKKCQCYVIEKLGAKILGDVVNWLKSNATRNPRGTSDLLGLTVRSSGPSVMANQPLLEIAEKVIAWGCAYPRLET